MSRRAPFAVVHFTPQLGALEDNRRALVALAREAAGRARVVALPELAVTGFSLDMEQASTWAEPLDGPSVEGLREVARDRQAVLVVGLALRDEAGVLRNAQVVLDADGAVAGTYAKHHLFGADHTWAQAGPTPGAVVETAAGRVGLLICHDIVYPATVFEVGRQAPDLVAFSTAWVGDEDPLPSCWLMAWVFLGGVPLLIANRGGREGSMAYRDPSALIVARPDGLMDGVVGQRGEESQVLLPPGAWQ
jgi:predicted amidohydrolase